MQSSDITERTPTTPHRIDPSGGSGESAHSPLNASGLNLYNGRKQDPEAKENRKDKKIMEPKWLYLSARKQYLNLSLVKWVHFDDEYDNDNNRLLLYFDDDFRVAVSGNDLDKVIEYLNRIAYA